MSIAIFLSMIAGALVAHAMHRRAGNIPVQLMQAKDAKEREAMMAAAQYHQNYADALRYPHDRYSDATRPEICHRAESHETWAKTLRRIARRQ